MFAWSIWKSYSFKFEKWNVSVVNDWFQRESRPLAEDWRPGLWTEAAIIISMDEQRRYCQLSHLSRSVFNDRSKGCKGLSKCCWIIQALRECSCCKMKALLTESLLCEFWEQTLNCILIFQHHCRKCGRVLCYSCSNNWVSTPHSGCVSSFPWLCWTNLLLSIQT